MKWMKAHTHTVMLSPQDVTHYLLFISIDLNLYQRFRHDLLLQRVSGKRASELETKKISED